MNKESEDGYLNNFLMDLRWGIRNSQTRKKCGLKFNSQIRIYFQPLLGNQQSSNSQKCDLQIQFTIPQGPLADSSTQQWK
jgi:hypothetical protein